MKGVGSVNRDAERTERNIPLTRRAPAPICVDVHAPKQAGGPGDVGRAVAVRRLAAFNTPQRRGPSEANDAMPSLVIRTLIFDGVCGTRGRYHIRRPSLSYPAEVIPSRAGCAMCTEPRTPQRRPGARKENEVLE